MTIPQIAKQIGISEQSVHAAIERKSEKHPAYILWLEEGEPIARRSKLKDPLARLMEKTTKRDNGCWEWVGGRRWRNNSYGYVKIKGVSLSTHKLSYILHKGEVPEGLQVCHTCDNPICLNPDHLFLGTGKDNMQDKVAKGRHFEQQKTHCKHGHEFTPENTFLKKGKRNCRECHRQSSMIYYNKKYGKQHTTGDSLQ